MRNLRLGASTITKAWLEDVNDKYFLDYPGRVKRLKAVTNQGDKITINYFLADIFILHPEDFIGLSVKGAREFIDQTRINHGKMTTLLTGEKCAKL